MTIAVDLGRKATKQTNKFRHMPQCESSQGTKIFQYCTRPAGQATYNFHSSCKHMHSSLKGALAWYGKLTWESAHAWILIILYYLIVWGITLIVMVRLSFYAIPLLIYDVMNDITIIP